MSLDVSCTLKKVLVCRREQLTCSAVILPSNGLHPTCPSDAEIDNGRLESSNHHSTNSIRSEERTDAISLTILRKFNEQTTEKRESSFKAKNNKEEHGVMC